MTDKLPAVLAELDAEMANRPERVRKCIEAYKKRLQGYSLWDIAEGMSLSMSTVSRYLEWANENLPVAYCNIDEFIRTSVERLEIQYSQLNKDRMLGDLVAHRVSAAILDQQAKLLGAYTVKIEHSGQVEYVIEGVDMDKL